MRRRIKSNIVYSTVIKPGQRPTDKRYKDGVDTGRFSSNRVPLPLKPKSPVSPAMNDMLNDLPKQVLRQKHKPGNHRGKRNFEN